MLAILALTAFAVASVAVKFLVSRFPGLALDQPNSRSLHERPVPRSGGIAVLLAMALSLGFDAAPLWLPMALAGCVAVVSFLDDLGYRIPTVARLLAHLAAAAVFCWYVLTPMGAMELAALVLAVVWITNLYNFMDGADGVAAGMTFIGFGGYALAAYSAGHAPLAAMCLAVCAGAAAFLVYNFYPARIFLGDVGAIPLGFLAAALGIQGWRDDVWPLWFPVLVFGPFIADASATLLRRLVRGDQVWKPHRDHYYQRMVRMGLGHRRTACAGYIAMLVCAAASLFGRTRAPMTQALLFLSASLLLAAAALWVDLQWARHNRKVEGTS